MKLYATTTSERGKPVSKGANTALEINIKGELRQELWHIVILPNIDGGQITVYKNGKYIFEDLSDKTEKCYTEHENMYLIPHSKKDCNQ